MALESWLNKVKTAISNGFDSVRTSDGKKVGVLAFEVASLLAKLVQLWQSMSDKNMAWIRHEAIALDGVRKIVSNDDSFLLGLACAELSESLRLIASSIGRIGRRCDVMALRSFDRLFADFADSGKDPHGWVMGRREMDSGAVRKMTRLVSASAALHKAVDEMAETEQSLRKLLGYREPDSPVRAKKVADLQQKLFLKKQEVKHLKEYSLWTRSFDSVAMLMARSVFTVLARLKHVFGLGHDHDLPAPVSRNLSATVFPSNNSAVPSPTAAAPTFISGPRPSNNSDESEAEAEMDGQSFFYSNSKLLKRPPSTLGAAALALHYANLINVLEKMIRSPHLVGLDARDDLYGMLPASLRSALRARLWGVGASAADPELAAEWRNALSSILEWLAPLAHNTIRWQSERSFEQQGVAGRSCAPVAATNVLLLQTLVFANQAKAEAAITELLVGLNYVWRFEREMSARALLECSKLNGYLKLQTCNAKQQED